MRFKVVVRREERQKIPRTAFDPLPELVFRDRERAVGWMQALNTLLGTPRFEVVEVADPRSAQNEADVLM
jgi:hypothetical protein